MLRTLREAGTYIAKLPRAKQQSAHWQTAAEALIMAAEDRGPIMHARIGMLRALNHGRPSPSLPPRAKKPAKAYRMLR